MFHLVHKPLTTPSFLLVDGLCAFGFFFSVVATLPSPFPSLSVCLCLSLIPSLCSILENELMLFQFYMLATLSICLSVFLFLFLFSLQPPPNALMHFHKFSSSFFMAVLKGLLPAGNGDEERHAG